MATTQPDRIERIDPATAPFGRAGAVAYGPNVNAAAILVALQGNVPVEATAGTRKSPPAALRVSLDSGHL